MTSVIATEPVDSVELQAVVTRCGCGDPLRIHTWSFPEGSTVSYMNPCPTPRAVEDRGTVAYWNRSFWRRLRWKLWRKI